MGDETDMLSKARSVLHRALISAARDLADMDPDTSAHTIAGLATQIAAIQTGIESLDRALTVADRYRPSYYGDR